jgi:hypothetical protein
MYFPYLRAKQFELIALRELVERQLVGNRILPIIEPVKLSSTLTKTIEQYSIEGRAIGVILNPKVGNFVSEISNVNNDKSVERFIDLIKGPNILSSHITNDNSMLELRELFEQGLDKRNIILIHKNRGYLEKYTTEFESSGARYNLIPDESVFRRIVRDNRVLFNDKFAKKSRNTDYTIEEDEFFSALRSTGWVTLIEIGL